MTMTLGLGKMNITEKIQIMETIWDDLCHTADAIVSPEWHKDVLQKREKKIQDGTATFYRLEEAKRMVWDAVNK